MIRGIAHDLNLWGNVIEWRGMKREHFVFGWSTCRDTPSNSLSGGGGGLLAYGLGQLNNGAGIPIRGGSLFAGT